MQPIAILGAGSWGTALALYLSRRGQVVNIWSIDPEEIRAMKAERSNSRFMPGFPFPDTIFPTDNLATAVKSVEDVLIVVPSIGFRSTLSLLKKHSSKNMRLICASKGLDTEKHQLLNEVAVEIFGKHQSFAVLSGPSFAREVAAGLPTAVTVATTDPELSTAIIDRFNSNIFRVFPTDDIVGVEIGGVVKNVLAVATGISDGLGLGADARSALLTFGFQEMISLGLALGGKIETFTGLSGIGDLILTSLDDLSRNRRFGLALGQGQSMQAAELEIGQAVEGKRNAAFLVEFARQHQVKMPVCEMTWQILQSKVSAKEGFERLFAEK